MDIPSEKYNSGENEQGSIFAKLQAVAVFFSSFIRFFTITEEERLQAVFIGAVKGVKNKGLTKYSFLYESLNTKYQFC